LNLLIYKTILTIKIVYKVLIWFLFVGSRFKNVWEYETSIQTVIAQSNYVEGSRLHY